MAALLQMDFSLKSFLWLYYKWAGKWRFGAYDQTSADYDIWIISLLSNSCVGRKLEI
jgi:hypothetical protein